MTWTPRCALAAVVVALVVGRASIALAWEQVVTVSMRDGVTIRTYVRTPAGNGPWPAVLKKGYGITKSGADTFLGAGYAFVAQGVRSGADPHGISGNARFFADDVDGYDTIEWIAKQPWCDGNVAMFGPSYWGATQWMAAANGDPGPPPHLKAIIPSVINPDFWERSYRAHGAMNLSMTAISRAFGTSQASYDAYMHLPLIDMDEAVGGKENTLWNEYVSHWTYDDYWAHIGMRDKYRRIKIPVYIYAGWWDYYSGASLEYYNLLRRAGHTPEIRVWVGNSGHSQMSLSESIRWLDWVVKRKDNGMKDQPPVRLFVQGIDQERHYDQWPPSGIEYVKYYLRSPDGSRTGTLDMKPPSTEPPTRYTYDPRHPVPSIGGNANHRGVNKTLKSGAVLREGSFDQRTVETRDDVLVFTTPALEEDVEIIGPVSFELYAATDARDTDFTAVLIDVLPDGKAMNVTEGVVRARFRESIWEAPKLLEPGQVYEYTLELLPTARVFQKRHKIRVHLSSSRFPLWDRNTNTGNDPATDTQTKVAHQTIYHDAARPSHLVLPVIPAKADKPPYPPSPVIKRVTWHWESHRTAAPGSDLWPVTWGPDGHIYTAWGDGGGFGGTNADGRVSMGFARIEGPPENYRGININGGKNTENPASFPRRGKTGGILSVGGTLYARLNLQDGKWPNVNHSLAWSDDRGATWKQTSWVFPKGEGNFKPARFLNFGKDYSGVPKELDGYVYIYGFNQAGGWGSGKSTYLARVPKDKMTDRDTYEFWTGHGENGKPKWSSDVSDLKPVFTDPRGATPGTVVYNPTLKRFLLTSFHTGPGQLGVFDAAQPWGPWTTVAYYESWGEMGSDGHGLNCGFPRKWISPDGLTMWSVFSVYGAGAKKGINAHDRFNLIKASLTLH